MNKRIITMLIISMLIVSSSLSAHADEDHSKTKTEQTRQTSQNYQVPALSEFPSLHPLVIHFPIVLFLLAPGLWLIGLWRKNRDLFSLALTANIFGLMTAIIAANWLHPHTINLPIDAQAALDLHDFWADWTLYTALLATILMGFAIWIRRFAKTTTLLALVVAISTAICVSITGHFGAALTHVYGIGPQGQNLEIKSEHENRDEHEH